MAPNTKKISHLQSTYDTILFGEAKIREAKVIKETLEDYCESSGQQVNKNKSNIFFFNTDMRKQREIAKILGFKVSLLPSRYLGIPLFLGESKSTLWDPLISNITNKLASWKGKWLSTARGVLVLK